MTTIILAAGYGTRLYPLTLNKPKALLEVGGKTILDRLVENIARIEKCGRIIIVSNEKFYAPFRAWQESARYGPEIEVINDRTTSNETRIGAIGDIKLALLDKKIKDDLLITGSDNLFDLELKDFVKFGTEKKPASSLMLCDVGDLELATKYGICMLDGASKVIDFEEKPKKPKSTLAASALYFIPAEKIQKISEYMKTGLSKDAPGNLIRWLAEKDAVYGYVYKGAWFDIGDKLQLEKADREFKQKDREEKK